MCVVMRKRQYRASVHQRPPSSIRASDVKSRLIRSKTDSSSTRKWPLISSRRALPRLMKPKLSGASVASRPASRSSPRARPCGGRACRRRPRRTQPGTPGRRLLARLPRAPTTPRRCAGTSRRISAGSSAASSCSTKPLIRRWSRTRSSMTSIGSVIAESFHPARRRMAR